MTLSVIEEAPVRTAPLARARPARALVLGCLGALLGLGMAGYGLFTAKGTVVRSIPAEDVALVNQRPILASDYAAQMQTVAGKKLTEASSAERQAVLDDMIREELMVQRGLELDEPSTDPDTRAALVAAVQAQVAVDATSQVPAETDLRAFYAQRAAHYARMGSMRVRDFVASSRDEAVNGAQALRAGQPAPDLRETKAVTGEEIDFAANIHLGADLFAVASGLADGAVSDPVKAPDGWHVLVMMHRVAPRQRSFEDARSQVYSDYKDDLIARLRDGEYRYLRSKADILVASPP